MKWVKRDENLNSIKEIISKRDFSVPEKWSFVRNMHEAVLLTKKCIREGMHITIVGDYDCDGITSSSNLKLSILRYISILNTGNKVDVIIPDRYKEGYGLNMSIVDRIKSGLMITVDNGIAAVEQITKAKKKGLTVIVIDHHLIRDDGLVPEADVVVDPHIDDSEFQDYCGAGLAYRFAEELIPNDPLLPKLLSLAAIGTIADVMPIIRDNRRLVIEGLKLIADRIVPYGLNLMLDCLEIDEYVNEEDIGFHIGPCFNALGRMYGNGGKRMVDLITADEPDIYDEYSRKKLLEEAIAVINVNEERQLLVKKEMDMVYGGILKDTSPVIIIEDSTVFTKGTVGIIAGKLTEKYGVPAIVFTQDTKNPNNLTGSGRSPEDVHLKQLLDKVSQKYPDMFVGYGGHAGAAGLTIRKTAFDALKYALKDELKDYKPDNNIVYYDLECKILDVPVLYKELMQYAPFGEGNRAITFKVDNISGIPKIIGKLKNHFKLQGPDVTLLGFDLVEKWLDEGEPSTLDVIGTLGVNHYKDKDLYQIRLIDFKKHVEATTVTYDDLASLFTL